MFDIKNLDKNQLFEIIFDKSNDPKLIKQAANELINRYYFPTKTIQTVD
jgi:hypothetical protein